LSFLNYTARNRLFLAILFSFLTVAGLASVAFDDLLLALVRGLIDDAFSASGQRIRIPTRVAGETIQKYIDESTELFRRADGRFIDVDGPGPNGGLTLARINFKDKIIYRFRGAEIQDTVEELLHFRQAQKAGLWGRGGVSKTMLELWETQVDNLFRNLGFVPR
jgi:hypothetical protein